MSHHHLDRAELRRALSQSSFTVKGLAAYLRLGLRTFERAFTQQYDTTPKTWIIQERMNLALPLLTNGWSNKEVAAELGYSCESNFCRDFKHYFDCAPQAWARQRMTIIPVTRFDKASSRFDKPLALLPGGDLATLSRWENGSLTKRSSGTALQ